MKFVRVRVLKITQLAHRHFWYSSLLGGYVPALGLDAGFWKSREPDGALNFVAEDHARPVWALVRPEQLREYPYCHTPEGQAWAKSCSGGRCGVLGVCKGLADCRRPAPKGAGAAHHAGQSRRHSAIEAATNIGVGFVVSLGITAVVMPLFGHDVTWAQNFWITSIFTVASLLRSYALRRLFNRWAA